MTVPKRRCRPEPPAIAEVEPMAVRPRGDFVAWLAATGGALAVTTYNSGKLAIFTASSGVLAARCWRLPRPMGLACDGPLLAVAARDHVLLLRRRPSDSRDDRSSGVAIALERAYTTGRLDAHEVAVDRRGLLLAATRFNCVARPSDRVDFVRHWRPPFIDHALAKDCCHLNGLGVRSGRLAMVTAFCVGATPAAWREADRFQSGVLYDVRAGRIVATGLCMPHSPRWHAGRWLFCDSGRGVLCALNGESSPPVDAASLPGFTRGLTFAGGRAVVGLSRIRKRHVLDAPPVRERFSRLRSGVWLVDPTNGRVTGSLEFQSGGREVFDVALWEEIGYRL
jgi:uncharacterized protein (TIGR03032 family)